MTPADENPWGEYERRKKELPPTLTIKQYDDAIKQICSDLGI